MHLPPWLKRRIVADGQYLYVKKLLKEHNLNTVCESACCPNQGICFGKGTATFMILGDVCTRDCRFCAVPHGKPEELDPDEPRRVAEAVKILNLKHAVITSVTRDDLPDGGASVFAQTIRLIKEYTNATVEVLIPDFMGSLDALKTVLDARPHILNHNVETVPRLYPKVRPQADFQRSLWVLKQAKMWDGVITKSGFMVGLGESWEEIIKLLQALREVGCNIVTVGQYLAPSKKHLPVEKFYHPEEFVKIEEIGQEIGFDKVFAGPFVRSSFNAAEVLEEVAGNGRYKC